MPKTPLTVSIQAFAIVAASAALAVGTDLVRPDGIPLVTDVEYDIFAPCRDSEAESEAASTAEIVAAGGEILYVDARPAEAFAEERVDGAINAPYSVLFGASAKDVARVAEERSSRGAKAVVVYGLYSDPGSPGQKVDVAESLAEQLLESGIEGIRHVEGGLEEMKKSGVETVKGNGEQ